MKYFTCLVGMLLVCLTLSSAVVAQEATPETTVEPIPTLANIDRIFEATEGGDERHRRLVDIFIAPMVQDERVLDAMRAVPRHSFVPTELLELAYEDHPLPIGYGQTISQPSLVAMMTEVLELEEDDKVLEIGTGSGYQAAILRELTEHVYSVEIIPELTSVARTVLDALDYEDVELMRADGYFGWEAHAPFDAIIVTAAPDHLPRPLVNQLNPDGGRMVIPIGPVGDVQTLWLVTREGDEIAMQRLLDVRFVPFTRENE